MNYGHEWDEGTWRENAHYCTCKLCGREMACFKSNSDGTLGGEAFPASEEPCPERIVQEVVRRLKAELRHVNVVPAKRKDRPR